MARKKPERFDANYRALVDYCRENDYEIHEFAGNVYQYRIMGDTAIVDIWPSRMKVHVIASEYPERVNDYRTLDFVFNPKQLDKLLKEEG